MTIAPPIPGGPDDAADALRARLPSGFVPRAALVLGSGLGGIADRIEDAVAIPYGQIPGFFPPGVHGHAGRLVFGRLAGIDVAVMQGRKHTYEGLPSSAVTTPIRTLKLLGCSLLFLAVSLSRKRAHRIEVQKQRWKDIKELEEDYDVYVSDEYAYHIADNKMHMHNIQEYGIANIH
jgi:hypothetical protein